MAVRDWSTTPSTNATADADEGINWAENQAPGTINDSARAMMAETKEWYDAFQSPSASGGIQDDISSNYEERLAVTFTASLPRIVVFARGRAENTTVANVVEWMLEIVANAGGAVVNYGGTVASAAASDPATGHGVLFVPANLTVGASYKLRLLVRKQVPTGPIYPRDMVITSINF